jgi:hypothetical protein
MPENGMPSLEKWLTELTIGCVNAKSFHHVEKPKENLENKSPRKKTPPQKQSK